MNRPFCLSSAFLAVFAARAAFGAFAYVDPQFTQCDLMQRNGTCADTDTGFTGIIELPDGRIFVNNFCDGAALTFTPGATCPGSPATPVQVGAPADSALVLGFDGKLYTTRNFDRVVEIDPATGAPVRTVAPPTAGFGALGLAVDPQTGDLYTSCFAKVWRIQSPGSATPVVSQFADTSAYVGGLDGCAFSCDGSFLLAADGGAHRLVRVDRNGTVSLFVQTSATVGVDGVCFGAPGTPLFGNVYTNNTDGSVTEFPIANPAAWRVIACGSGLRGDFLTVDSQGNLLVTCNKIVTRLSSVQQGRFDLPGSSLCSNMECAAQADLACIENHGIRTSIRVAIPFICDPANPSNARLARTCNSIDKLKKHSPGCAQLLDALRAMRDFLMTLASTPDCSGE